MLIDDMEKSGYWLFRWRGYLPLITVVLLLSSLPYFTYPFSSHLLDQLWELFCLSMSFAGLAVRITTIGFAPPRTSGRNTKQQVADTLNTCGMYSVTRNPLYFGNFLVGLGISLFFRTWWVTSIYTLLFFLYYERIIIAEEMFLKRKFQQRYMEWSQQTPLFLPNFQLWRSPTQTFNLRKVCGNEHQTLFIIVIIFYGMELVGDYYLSQKLMDDEMWNILAGIVTVLFITARILHKRTMIFKTEK